MPIRLQRYLSMAGVAARRKAEAIISAGRVSVNGEVVTELGTKVDPSADHVTVDGKEIRAEELFYAVLNKPKGCITAVTDDRGRRTVMEYLPNLPVKVAPVGRLDYYSEGVLLLTNDGELSAALQSPQRHVEKTYHVKYRGTVEERHLDAWRRGIRLDDGRKTKPAKVERLRTESRHEWLELALTEGRSRQIHRMAEAFGYQVTKLQRVSFGGLSFYGLRIGDARELTQEEVNALRVEAGLPAHDKSVARGTWKVRREQSERRRRIGNLARKEREGGVVTKKASSKKHHTPGGEQGRPSKPARDGGSQQGKPASGKPASGKPTRGKKPPSSAGRPSRGKPSRGKPSGGKPSGGKPSGGRKPAGGRRSASGKPTSGGRPSSGKPTRGKKPSSGKPTRGKKPGGKKPAGRKKQR